MTTKPTVEFYDVARYFVQDDRVNEDLPFGTRGGLAVRHYFPLDAEYSVRVHLQRRGPGQEIDVRLDGQRIKTFVVAARNRADEEAEDAQRRRRDGGPRSGSCGSAGHQRLARQEGWSARGARARATAGREHRLHEDVPAPKPGSKKSRSAVRTTVRGPAIRRAAGRSSPAARPTRRAARTAPARS